MDIKNIKKDFPIFKQQINGKQLVYLDSANSSQKPKVVIDRISRFYETEFSNVGRSVHALAVKATNSFEATRDKVQKYLNANHREEIIFTKGATEAINLVACSIGEMLKPGDEIITTPWTMSATAMSILHFNAIPIFCDIDPNTFNIDASKVESLITPRTKAILSVDIFGQSADTDKLNKIAKKYNIKVRRKYRIY